MATHDAQATGAGIPAWTLGWRLKRALAHANVRAEEMADELGVHPSTVSRWMNDHDETPPKAGFLRVWALRCGVPFEWLASGQEDVPSTKW